MGNFDFVTARWPQLAESARRAEGHLRADPRASATYARLSAEHVTAWIYAAEDLARPHDATFANLTAQKPFRDLVGESVWGSLKVVRLIGNAAAHRDEAVPLDRARSAVEQLHRVFVWLEHCYGDPAASTQPPFSFDAVPAAPGMVVRQARAELERMQAEFDEMQRRLTDAQLLGARAEAEAEALRAELASRKERNLRVPDPTDRTEAETRAALIDEQLHQAGWRLDDPRDREWPLTGIPSPSGTGKADYVLWGDDGLPLAVIEAKREGRSAKEGRLQARLYADALERDHGQRPVIFYTNGYDTWIWDDLRYPPRSIAGFLTKDELGLVVQRRTSIRPLSDVAVDSDIVERPYQLRAITAVGEAFEAKRRRALLAMATGTGKTRTVIALVDQLQRANWVKRVLFLADRTTLVRQAAQVFGEHLGASAPVNLLTDRESDGRVYVSTYQTLMGLIDAGSDDQRRFGPGYFDLIVVDEAHRSIYNRYGEIFDYFDALVVGLTATPRADIDHNTYRLFELDDGVPTDSYDLEDAIAAGYLVPPIAQVVDLGFMTRGIRYADLSDAEKERWDALEWEDGEIPDAVDAAAMNRWLFNEGTVDAVLEILMTRGHRVAGGTRLGKTIVFAKSQRHAEFIQERFDHHYPELGGAHAEVITHAAGAYAETLIGSFSTTDKDPQIAISVDMLDTGLDVPDVVNLVFFKPVHSQTKYWQMVGRGTRLRPDLYGPGADKTDFLLFDVCGNVEYFNAEMPDAAPARPTSLPERAFALRLRLLGALAGRTDDDAGALRTSTAEHLHATVAGMNRNNFLVRKRLRAVDRFSDADAWSRFSPADATAAAELGGLPTSAHPDADEAAQRFDLLLLEAQAAVAEGDPVPAGVVRRVIDLAHALADRRGIPVVAAQASLLSAIAEPGWWDAATLALLETVRMRMRGLIRLIDRAGQKPVYTDFDDAVLDVRTVDVARVVPGVDRRAFREKVLGFLRAHEDNIALHKLRSGRQLTETDLGDLEAILIGAGGVDEEQLRAQAGESGGLGRFIRSIIGLDRSAVEAMLADFASAPAFSQRQHAFMELVIQQLTIAGHLDPRRLYEDPFTGIAADGPDGVFDDSQVVDLFGRLRLLDASADPETAATA